MEWRCGERCGMAQGRAARPETVARERSLAVSGVGLRKFLWADRG